MKHTNNKRFCIIFTYDDCNVTRECYAFDTYEEAYKALIDYFRDDDLSASDDDVKKYMEDIENGTDRWFDNGKSWEITILYDK